MLGAPRVGQSRSIRVGCESCAGCAAIEAEGWCHRLSCRATPSFGLTVDYEGMAGQSGVFCTNKGRFPSLESSSRVIVVDVTLAAHESQGYACRDLDRAVDTGQWRNRNVPSSQLRVLWAMLHGSWLRFFCDRMKKAA